MADFDSLQFLRIGHVNAQSLEPHFTDIQAIILERDLHLMAVSESWLHEFSNQHLISIPGYSLLRADRVGKRGGGVAMYVRDSISSKFISRSAQPYCSRPEFLLVELCFNSYKILSIIVYKPPTVRFWSDVEEAILNYNAPTDYVLLLGDLNINWLVPSSARKILQSSFHTCGLQPLAFQPTHHIGSAHSTIDYVCVSDSSLVQSFSQLQCPYISNHDVLLVTLGFKISNPLPRFITCRSLKDFNMDNFHRDISTIDWQHVCYLQNIDDKVRYFTSSLLKVYDRHAPYHSFTVKKPPSPWLNESLKQLIRARNRAWSKFKRTRYDTDRHTYNSLRNEVKMKIRDAITKYYCTKLSVSRGKADFWKIVDEMDLKSKSRSLTPLNFSVDCLNKHFIGKWDLVCRKDTRPTVRISPDNRFYFKHIEPGEALTALKSMRSNAKGPDDIPLKLLKDCIQFILPSLLNIFDSSLQSGVFPSDWKSALVRPLPKKKLATELDHFRPISILCAASKLLESIACRQMSDYIAANNLLDPLQSGFRKKHSTHTALIHMVENIRLAADNEMVTLLVAIDFSRAFDLIDISLLSDKLKSLGFSDTVCNWVYSFLSDRTQVVKAPCGDLSRPLTRSSGVPQGSICGPLLFSLFANDAPSACLHCKYHFYADDLTIYFHGHISDVSNICSAVNSDLERLRYWAQCNGLSINANKSKAVWFGTRKFVSRLYSMWHPPVVMDDQIIEICETVKILGVQLDCTLSWHDQCAATTRNCFAALSRLRKCGYHIPPGIKLTLVKTLVFPFLDYCAGLFLGLSSELTMKLSRCKNAAMRFVTSVRKFDHITPSYRENLVLPYVMRRNYLCCSLVAAILRSKQPSYLAELFNFRSKDGLGYKRGSEFDLVIRWARTNFCKFSFAIETARQWNEIPSDIRALFRQPCFNKMLLIYFLRKAFCDDNISIK